MLLVIVGLLQLDRGTLVVEGEMITAPLIFNITYVRFISSLWERLWMVHILYAVPLTTTSPVMRGRG